MRSPPPAPVKWICNLRLRALCLLPRVTKNYPVILEDPVLNAIAEKHQRTAAQVALRYQLQRGLVVLAKSFTEKRIQENFQVQGRVEGSRDWQYSISLVWLLVRLSTCTGSNLSPCTLCMEELYLIILSSTCCRMRGAWGLERTLNRVKFSLNPDF